MDARTRDIVGIALVVTGAVGFGWAAAEILQFGSCGADEQGVVVRECPPEHLLRFLAMVGGFLMLVGGGVIAESGRVTLAAIGAAFTAFGVASAVGAFAPASTSDFSTPLMHTMSVVFLAVGVITLIQAARPSAPTFHTSTSTHTSSTGLSTEIRRETVSTTTWEFEFELPFGRHKRARKAAETAAAAEEEAPEDDERRPGGLPR